MSKNKLALLLTMIWFSLIMIVTIFTMGQEQNLDQLGIDDKKMQLLVLQLTQIFSVFIIFVGPAIGIVMLLPEKLKFLNIHIRPKLNYIVLGSLAMVSALPIINFLSEWNASFAFPESMKSLEEWIKLGEAQAEKMMLFFLEMNSLSDLLMNILVIGVAAAVCEEIFFRGLMQKQLLNFTKNIHIAIWITAILFSAMHGQFLGFIPRMILGAVLGYMYVWSGSLWVPIIGHFVNNTLAVIVVYFVQSNVLSPETETIGTNKGEIYFVFASTVIVLGLLYFMSRNKEAELALDSNK